MLSKGTYSTALTPGRTVTQAGLLGADLGYPVVYPDKILILFGDSLGAFTLPRKGRDWYLAKGSGANDSIGFIANMDSSNCHYIESVDRQVSQSRQQPRPDTDGCPALTLFKKPDRTPGDPEWMPITIRGLQPGEGTGPFMTPSGAFDYHDRLYVFYVVRIQEGKPHLALKSILAKSTEDSRGWEGHRTPMFQRISTVSEHPGVQDPAHLSDDPNDLGKFMFNPVATMDQKTLNTSGVRSGLPPELQPADQVIFVFGSSFRYNRSNLYLAAFAAKDADAGTAKWFYYRGGQGASRWASDERLAAPLLPGDPRIGNHSVIWNPVLGQFVLMYGNVIARCAPAPWGPWSEPVNVFPPDGPWAQKLVHQPGRDALTRTGMRVYRVKDNSPWEPEEARGIPYGPYLIDKSTQNADGSVTLYFTLSTWTPYEVFLVKTSVFKH